MTPIKYIGHRSEYRDGACGSGAIFKQGETLNISDDSIAAKMLRHPTVYARGDGEGEGGAIFSVAGKDSDDSNEIQDARDIVANLDKDALQTYAKTNFSVNVDKRKSVEALRSEVTGMIDRFGISK